MKPPTICNLHKLHYRIQHNLLFKLPQKKKKNTKLDKRTIKINKSKLYFWGMKFGEASIFVTQILKSLDFDPKISKKKKGKFSPNRTKNC